MTKHGKIKEKLRKEYISKGYNVEVEGTVVESNGKWWVVDLIVIKGKEKIAIEIGTTYKRKLDFLKTKFSKVIHIPFIKKSSDGYIIHTLCDYRWKPRVQHPKECPNCKRRIDLKLIEKEVKKC